MCVCLNIIHHASIQEYLIYQLMHNDRQYSLCTTVDSCLNEHHTHCSAMLVLFIYLFIVTSIVTAPQVERKQ